MIFQIDPTITIGYLVLGYAAMWVVALIYVVSLAVRQRNLKRDIELMKQLLESERSENE